MKRPESALFPATAIPLGAAALTLTGWMAWRDVEALADALPALLLLALLSVPATALSFAPTHRHRVSLGASYDLAAVLALPFPSALIIAATRSLGGSMLRAGPSLGALRFLSVTGANVTIATAMALAATGLAAALGPWLRELTPTRPSAPAESLPAALLMASVLFACMSLVNLALVAAWLPSRGRSARLFARSFLTRTFPLETMTIPFGALLASLLQSGSSLTAPASLAALGLILSFLLWRLSHSEERLRIANEELGDRLAELAALNSLSREIASTLDPSALFGILRRGCRRIFRPDFLWMARQDPSSRELRIEYSLAGEGPIRYLTCPPGQGLASHIVNSERSLLVTDAPRDPRLASLGPIVLEPQVRSILAVPLMVEGRAVGGLSVQSFRDSAYDERHLGLLTTIAQQAAVAVENARNYERATIDRLTGLLQRESFLQRLEEEHRRAERYATPFALLMLDLDSFKEINDRFGHFAGDRFLQAVGACLKSALRSVDIPCRYGGEEFSVLLPRTDGEGARTIAERVRRAIADLRVTSDGHPMATTISIGIASHPEHALKDPAGLLRIADEALLAAKRQGKDRTVLAHRASRRR